eukprot:Filipodium_phascolosomae@DN1240_c0_g1_i1.p1
MRAIGSCAGTLRYGRRVPGALPSFLRGCGSLLVPPYAATATISSVALWDYFANRRQTKPNDPLTDSPDTSSTTASATTTTTTSASSTPPSPKFWYPYEPEPWRPADASLNKGFNRLDQFPRRARGAEVPPNHPYYNRGRRVYGFQMCVNQGEVFFYGFEPGGAPPVWWGLQDYLWYLPMLIWQRVHPVSASAFIKNNDLFPPDRSKPDPRLPPKTDLDKPIPVPRHGPIATHITSSTQSLGL